METRNYVYLARDLPLFSENVAAHLFEDIARLSVKRSNTITALARARVDTLREQPAGYESAPEFDDPLPT